MADGTITFATDLDNKELEKKLQSTQKKIERLEDSISQKKAEQLPLVSQVERLEVELGKASKRLTYMQSGKDFFSSSAIKKQQADVSELRKEYDAVQRRVSAYDTKIENATIDLERQKEAAGGIRQQLDAASVGGNKMGDAISAAGAHMDKFISRVQRLAKRVLVFSVITMALRSLRNWFGKVVKTSGEASDAMAQLRGALLTMAQPLVDLIIPVFTFLVKVITAVVSALAQLFAMLTGKSVASTKKSAQALSAETDSISDAGDAAEKAQKQLAGFDEINQLSDTSSGDSGSGSSGSTDPDFSFDADMGEGQLKNILGLVEAVGAALLLWALPKTMTKNFKTFLGLLLVIDGVTRTIRAAFDAWTNGVNWDNFWQMILGGTEIVGGLWLAFGKTAGAIGLVVAGCLLIVTGFHDAMESGWDLQNVLMVIAGILAAGVGIALLTTSWIPVLIAAIAGLLLVITTSFGEGENLLAGVKTILDGFKDFFVGIFTGDIEKAIGGIGKIFSGLSTVFNSIVDAIKNMFNSFLDWIDEKTNGKLRPIINFVKTLIGGAADYIKNMFSAVCNAAKTIFGGIVKFISGVFTGDWGKAWEGVKDIFKGIWNGIVGILGTAVNAVIKGVNWLIGKLNSISFNVPSWIPGIGGKHVGINIPTVKEWQVPYLAQGAVIPPNREFMAVLGDQKRGTNIEAPLETIKQAVAEVIKGSGNGGGNIYLTVTLDGRVVFDNVVQRNNAIVRSTGESPLLT